MNYECVGISLHVNQINKRGVKKQVVGVADTYFYSGVINWSVTSDESCQHNKTEISEEWF